MNNEVQQPHDDDPAAHKRNNEVRRSDITVTDERDVKRAVKAAAARQRHGMVRLRDLQLSRGHHRQGLLPRGTAPLSLLSSFATFAVAFLVRPLGGMFFGPLGDRIGRKKVLALTMILMAAGTFCIGLIPVLRHRSASGAPSCCILFRMVQGFSTGGEYGGASTFIAEYAPDKRRGFFGSFLEFGTLIGYAGAAGLVTRAEHRAGRRGHAGAGAGASRS